MPVKRDFITDDADLLIFVVFFAGIYPGVWNMRLYFFEEVGFVKGVNRLGRIEGDVFIVAQFGISLVFNDFTAYGK